MLGVFYAVPFIALSFLCLSVCLVVPRLRRYALEAFIAPLAFGFTAILTFVEVIVISQSLGMLEGPLVGGGRILVYMAFYVAPGVLGTYVVLSLVRRVRGRLVGSRRRGDDNSGDSG